MTDPENLPGCPPIWRAESGPIRIRFLGRSARRHDSRRDIEGIVRQLAPEGTRIAWARQVHSATVLTARPGESGEGDALITTEPLVATSIATADCVPVAVSSSRGDALAAIHAGWRGIRAAVVARAVERLAELTDGDLTAWIGPAIGPCCYEVGEDVARAVAEASEPDVVDSSGPRPYLDLRAAVCAQLRASGVETLHHFDRCTKCHPDLLWSYRRDGQAAGRNWLLAWIEPPSGPAV